MTTLKAILTPEAYLEKIHPLRTPEEIETVCRELAEGLFSDQNYAPKTRANKLTPYNKLINEIPKEELVEGENAFIYTKEDGTLWKRHLHHYFLGLPREQWKEINDKSIVLDRLKNKRKVDINQYLDTAIKLLQSDDPHELAVGLIAVSGRRPVEILVRGSFSIVNELPEYLKHGYFVKFKGQAKKRDYDIPEDERVEYRIGLLVPAQFFLEAFSRFRKMPEVKELLDFVKVETKKGTSPEEINDSVEARRGNSLRKIVKREFGSFLPARFGETELDNKTLRAVYTRLIVERDCPKSIDGLLWASQAVGHFVDEEKPNDKQLKHLVTTLGYSDYYCDSKVPFLEAPQKEAREKLAQVRATIADTEIIKNLQDKLNLPNQQAVIHYLIQKFDQAEKLERQLLEAQTRIADLEKKLQENQEMDHNVLNPQQAESDDLETKIEAMVVKALQKHLPSVAAVQPQIEPVTANVTTKVKVKPEQPEKDWSAVPSDELRTSKARGASDERIYRAFRAACDYNDAQPSNDQRWFIGNVTLRDLSGCNGMLVKDWIERHQVSVDDHNQKYGLGQYHNKRHKGVEIGDVIKW